MDNLSSDSQGLTIRKQIDLAIVLGLMEHGGKAIPLTRIILAALYDAGFLSKEKHSIDENEPLFIRTESLLSLMMRRKYFDRMKAAQGILIYIFLHSNLNVISFLEEDDPETAYLLRNYYRGTVVDDLMYLDNPKEHLEMRKNAN